MHGRITHHHLSLIRPKYQHSISEHVQVVQLAVSGSANGLSRARTRLVFDLITIPMEPGIDNRASTISLGLHNYIRVGQGAQEVEN